MLFSLVCHIFISAPCLGRRFAVAVFVFVRYFVLLSHCGRRIAVAALFSLGLVVLLSFGRRIAVADLLSCFCVLPVFVFKSSVI